MSDFDLGPCELCARDLAAERQRREEAEQWAKDEKNRANICNAAAESAIRRARAWKALARKRWESYVAMSRSGRIYYEQWAAERQRADAAEDMCERLRISANEYNRTLEQWAAERQRAEYEIMERDAVNLALSRDRERLGAALRAVRLEIEGDRISHADHLISRALKPIRMDEPTWICVDCGGRGEHRPTSATESEEP